MSLVSGPASVTACVPLPIFNMAGDKETLLSMGFDSSRVECSHFATDLYGTISHFSFILLGALKATGNRGLQPAMDHILEHEGQPIPDIGGVSEQSGSSGTMDVDNEDEDAEALKSLGIVAGNAVEAKVRVKRRERV